MEATDTTNLEAGYTIDDLAKITVANWYKDDQTIKLKDPDNVTQGWLRAAGWTGVNVEGAGTKKVGEEYVPIYWYTYTRRILDTEKSLQSLVDYFTEAYNDGRSLNNQRFDDIVTMYASMIDRTEGEITDVETDEAAWKLLIDAVVDGLISGYTTHYSRVTGTLEDWGTAEEERIELNFDNKVSELRQNMISSGFYNTTTWTAVAAGIERDRNYALNDLSDKLIKERTALQERTYKIGHEVDTLIIDARSRVFAQIHAQNNQRTALRNAAVESLGRFAERREDPFPSISDISKLATEMGSGNPSNLTS